MATLTHRSSQSAVWSWFPALVYLILLHVLSAHNGNGNSSSIHMEWSLNALLSLMPRNFDSLAHFSEFSLLAILLWWPLRRSAPHWPELKVAKWVFYFGVLNSIVDEIHQAFIPGRSASVGDAVMDILGLAVTLAWLINRKKWSPIS